MKVLHLAAGNRWTGAAAPAFAEVEALRAAGHDAHYAYVGGYKLQAKIGRFDYTHPIIEKAQNPLSFNRTVRAIDDMVERHGFDFIHAHLTYDHWLARFVSRNHGIRMARTFHAGRVLRSDPFTRSLVARSSLLFVVNDVFRNASLLRDRKAVFTPPPLDQRQFEPLGDDVRAMYEIAPETRLITVIGKLSKGRGFEDALRTFALVRKQETGPAGARLMIIGHGEHRPVLEALTRALGIAEDVIWAGYHEDDLAEHYRAADLLFFTARGSDEGHRAVLEAMACGVIPATFPIDGVSALLGDLASSCIAPESTPESLAARVVSLLGGDLEPLRRAAWERSNEFGYERAAERLVDAYSGAMAHR